MNQKQRHDKICRIMQACLEAPTGERERVLHRESGDDASLIEDVRRLLALDESETTDAFSDDAIGAGEQALNALIESADLGPAPPDLVHPLSIGAYRIIRLIGLGGMGRVYEAEQVNPRRIVALKVLHPGLGTAEILSRFRREADLLGRMQHPGIAHVYEAGTGQVETASGITGQQSFFVMELIQGTPLDLYARKHNLDDRARLDLLAKICDAVQHAHDRGVIHRDLKPANILVTAGGQPKVLDFGVSRATNADVNTVTMRTDVGQLVGTIPYMSPEQVLGDPAAIDERSDVYSLGVVLFELLVGRLPLDVKRLTIPEAVRAIREDDPTLLGTIEHRLRGDVETIVAKAMEKDTERRYQSPAELGADVRRFLANEAVVARPASSMYILRKFARRRKALVGGIAATFAALLLGLVVATNLYLSASAERDAKVQALDEEKISREISDAVTVFLSEMLAAVDPGKQGRDVTVREILDDAASKIETRFAGQPLVEARLRGTIGQSYLALSEYQRAQEQLLPAIEIRQRILGENHVQTLELQSELGEVYYFLGRYAEANSAFKLVCDGFQRVLEPGDVRLISSKSDVAFMAMQLGQNAEAERMFLEAIALQAQASQPDHIVGLELKANLASLYARLGRVNDAEPLFLEVIEESRRIRGVEHPETIQSTANLASAYLFANQHAKAVPFLREALEVQQRVLGKDHSKTLISLHNLAVALGKTSQSSEAEVLLRDGLNRSRAKYGDADRSTILLVAALGFNSQRMGRIEEAEHLKNESLRLNRTLYGQDSRPALVAQRNLVKFYVSQAQFERAWSFAKGLDSQTENLANHTNVEMTTAHILQARCLIEWGRFDQAEPILLNAHPTAGAENQHRIATLLVTLYESGDRQPEADRWRTRLRADESADPTE